MKLTTIHNYPQVFKARRQEEISELIGDTPIPKDKQLSACTLGKQLYQERYYKPVEQYERWRRY